MSEFHRFPQMILHHPSNRTRDQTLIGKRMDFPERVSLLRHRLDVPCTEHGKQYGIYADNRHDDSRRSNADCHVEVVIEFGEHIAILQLPVKYQPNGEWNANRCINAPVDLYQREIRIFNHQRIFDGSIAIGGHKQ